MNDEPTEMRAEVRSVARSRLAVTLPSHSLEYSASKSIPWLTAAESVTLSSRSQVPLPDWYKRRSSQHMMARQQSEETILLLLMLLLFSSPGFQAHPVVRALTQSKLRCSESLRFVRRRPDQSPPL